VTGPVTYAFGDVRLDTGRLAAFRGGAAIPLEPKAFDVLRYLIEHRDRLVTKDELLDAVWPGTFVTPNALTRAVAQLRKVLGDDAHDAKYIETVSKRGYRFIAPVVVTPNGSPQDTTDTARSSSPRFVPSPVTASGWRRHRLIAGSIAGLAVVAAVAAFALKSGAIRENGTPSMRRVTTRSGYSGLPSLSPDGRAVVYASDSTDSLELYVVGLAPGSAEMALTNDRGQNVQPAWSPDGQWIAFHSAKRGGIWVVQSTGGTPRQIVDFGSDPAWSPDSARLVFTSDAGGMTSQSVLWTVSLEGSDARELTRLGQPPGRHRAPAWSHNGRLVTFIVSQGGWTNEIWVIDIAHATTRRIAVAPNGSSPCFAPDDRGVYWGGPNKEGNGRLWRHAISAEGNPIGEDTVVLPVGASAIDGVTIAPSGTIAFGLVNDDSNLWAIDVDATGRSSTGPVRLTDDVARNIDTDYSRDGRIVYTQMAVGLAISVLVSRDDGSAQAPLIAGTDAWNPQWDPSMKRILIIGGPSGQGRFGWVDVDTRRTTPLPLKIGDMRHPRLSPDGRELAFHVIEPNGVMNVWTQPLDGLRVKVTADTEAVSYPAWSPDGRSLAVEIKRGDQTNLGVVSRTGGPVEQLTFGRGQSWPHSWAPDNDRIAFAGQRDGVWNVYSVSRSTRVVTPLTHFTSASGYVRDPAWSPRGNRIVFERALRTGGVWTLAPEAVNSQQ
jgi:Tol biopolymer transport system component/DNA-binding winged helix-turn-helix (wHTH) protein